MGDTIAPKKVIFVDRDGTLLAEPADEQIDRLEKCRFVSGAISGMKAIAGLGYELVMVTNQDGLGTPAFPEETFWPYQHLLLDTLEGEGIVFDNILIDKSFPEDNAPTRKPRTGLLGAEIAERIRRTVRRATVARKTAETDIAVTVDLDGVGESTVDTGLKFFDHMLTQLVHHGGIALSLTCKGDLEVDEHHTMEDCAIALGEALREALGDKRGIGRYGFALPMDESRALVLLDFGGRSELVWDVQFTREYVGDTPTEMFRHFFKSLSDAMHANLYVQARGENNHHLAEGIFKAFARSLRQAVARNVFSYELPSSKGLL